MRWQTVGGTMDLEGGDGLGWIAAGSAPRGWRGGERESHAIDEEPCGGQSSPKRAVVVMLRSKSWGGQRHSSHRRRQMVTWEGGKLRARVESKEIERGGEFFAWRWLTPFIATNGRGCVCVHAMQVEGGGASQQLWLTHMVRATMAWLRWRRAWVAVALACGHAATTADRSVPHGFK
jgi:hypothetical protein